MRILVTGVYGFIGFSVARRLLEMGHEVVGIEKISNAISEKKARTRILENTPGFTVHDLDMSDFKATKKLLMSLDFDLILHLAGQYSKPYTEDVMLRFIDGNIRSWMHLMHVAYLKGIPRVVYASSTHVPATGCPTNMYGATLMFREIASKTYNEMGIQTVAIRYSTTYGEYMRADSPQAQIMKKIYTKKMINLNSRAFGGSYSWVHIDDAVELTIRALFRELSQDHVQVTAVANELPHDLGRCVKLIEEFSGLEAVTNGQYPMLKEPSIPAEQLAQMREIFDFVPKIDIRTGMKRYVNWYLKKGKAEY